MKAVILGIGALAVLGALAFTLKKELELGTETTVKSKDGASHRVRLEQAGAGFGLVAASSDTANRFAQGETIKALGRTWAWQPGLNAFTEVA